MVRPRFAAGCEAATTNRGTSAYEQDQGQESSRRAGRRRDDSDHLGIHQGQADPPLPRRRSQILRPRHSETRRDRRSDHDRCGKCHQGAWRRRQMRDDHARRGPRRGIRSQEDVAVAQWHDPQHSWRDGLPRADHLLERAAAGPGLDPADHHRPSCLWRPVPGDRFRRARQGQADHPIRWRRRRGLSSTRSSTSPAAGFRWRCTISTNRSEGSRAPA